VSASIIDEIRQTLDRFETISLREIERIVHRLPRKRGTKDGISTDIIRASCGVMSNELVEVINDSLSEGVCPADWKTSEIRPVPKVDKPRKADQFRPINVLSTLEKVLELVVKRQLDEHLENNNIITQHQLSFRKGYSCETAIQVVIDEWSFW